MAESWSTIEHRRVVVTGAGSGIGRAVTIALAQQGATVFALGRRPERLEETRDLGAGASGEVVAIPCDVTAHDQVDLALARIEAEGPATALVHAAAEMVKSSARDMTPSQFQQVVTSTLIGSFNVLHRWALPLLDLPERAAAVMLTSNSASLGTPGVSHSSAGKAGVEALTKSLAREWGPLGITINAVGPGVIPVEKSLDAWANPAVATRMKDAIALARYGELDEIVGPIFFFLSRAASYVTGQTLRVDGGLSLTRWSIEPNELASGINNRYGAAT